MDLAIVNFIFSCWLFRIFKKDEHTFTLSKTANNHQYSKRIIQGYKAFDLWKLKFQGVPKKTNKCETCNLKVSCIGPASKQFTKCLSQLVYREFGLKLRVVLATFKINRNFQQKTKTSHGLWFNVVYQFRCLWDTNLVYVGITSLHLAARASEKLVLAGPY